MQVDLQKTAPAPDYGKVLCEALCPVSGALDGISESGCSVHYDAPVTFSPESDYALKIRFFRFPLEEVALICHPEWSREHDGRTEIGFSILRSPDTARFEECVSQLTAERQDADDAPLAQTEEKCLFV